MALPIEEILEICNSNPGGVIEVFVVRLDHVDNIPYPIAHVITSDITFHPQGKWERWEFTPDTAGFKEIEKSGRSGESYNQELRLFIAQDRPEVADQFQNMTGGRYLALYGLPLGEHKLVGSKESPLRVMVDLETGSQATDRPGYTVRFLGQSTHKAYFYEGLIGQFAAIIFSISITGHLIYDNTPDPTLSMQVLPNGHLEATGPAEGKYLINSSGHLIFIP